LQTGDVILDVNGVRVFSPFAVRVAVADARNKGKHDVLMRVRSSRGLHFVAVAIGNATNIGDLDGDPGFDRGYILTQGQGSHRQCPQGHLGSAQGGEPAAGRGFPAKREISWQNRRAKFDLKSP
jgi:hypothetical protein